MEPIRRILVATDFSDCANAAADLAAQLARQTRACVQLISVVDTSPLVEAYGDVQYRSERIAHARDKARSQLMREVELRFAGVPNTEAAVRDGDTLQEIIQAAQDYKCDLIIVGTHGRSGLAHLIVGSVAEKLVRQSPVPVLTVRGS